MRLAGVLAIAAALVSASWVYDSTAPADAAWGDYGYALRVLNRDGSLAPDGTVVTMIRRIGREERRQIELTGIGPPACAVLVVEGGFAQLDPKPGPGCPEGVLSTTSVDYKDGTYPIVSEIDPPIDWRLRVGEGPPRIVTVRPIPPRT